MCGRYFIAEDAFDAYDIEALNRAAGVDISPGTDAPVLVSTEAESAQSMRWGFEREQGGLVINARVETMGEKPMFRGLAQTQRCAMPASRYYEWRRSDRQKYTIDLLGAERFFLAGLYRVSGDGRQFVVLTQPPVDPILPVHNRMPLILPTRKALARWFGGEVPFFENGGMLRITALGPEQLRMPF